MGIYRYNRYTLYEKDIHAIQSKTTQELLDIEQEANRYLQLMESKNLSNDEEVNSIRWAKNTTFSVDKELKQRGQRISKNWEALFS